MFNAKELLAAGIVRDIAFISEYALEIYLYGLDRREVVYEILDKFTRDDGSVIIRIVQQYNNSPLIQL